MLEKLTLVIFCDFLSQNEAEISSTVKKVMLISDGL